MSLKYKQSLQVMEVLKWATGVTKYTPSSRELYTPYKEGFSILPYHKNTTRYMAYRGRGKYGFKKSAIFYTIEEAREWLDSLPEYPNYPVHPASLKNSNE